MKCKRKLIGLILACASLGLAVDLHNTYSTKINRNDYPLGIVGRRDYNENNRHKHNRILLDTVVLSEIGGAVLLYGLSRRELKKIKES